MRSAFESTLIEEGIEKQLNDSNVVVSLHHLMSATNFLFSKKDQEKIDPGTLFETLVLLTNGSYDCYRTTNIIVNGSKIERTSPSNIPFRMICLLDNYYNVWQDIEDPYLKEAMFHIDFLKIHPFGDGNGRMARLITSYNLLKNVLPPIIIPKNMKREYCELIERDDYEGMANLFKSVAKTESETLFILNEVYNKSDDNVRVKTLRKEKVV